MTVRFLRPRLAALLLALCALLAGCRAPVAVDGSAPRVLVDGAAWEGGSLSPESADDLRVYVMLDGERLIDLPFGEAHTVDILLPDGGENHVALTGEAVYMTEANCPGGDCVAMGEVTRQNLEERVLGGFIICLPHRVSVEVRGQ